MQTGDIRHRKWIDNHLKCKRTLTSGFTVMSGFELFIYYIRSFLLRALALLLLRRILSFMEDEI